MSEQPENLTDKAKRLGASEVKSAVFWWTVTKLCGLISAAWVAYQVIPMPNALPYNNQAGWGELTCIGKNGLIRGMNEKKMKKACKTEITFTPYQR